MRLRQTFWSALIHLTTLVLTNWNTTQFKPLRRTSVYIYLPAHPEKLAEVLPIFSGNTKNYYADKNKTKQTWVSGNNQEIVFKDE